MVKKLNQLKILCKIFVKQSNLIKDHFSQQIQLGLVLKIFYFYISEFPKKKNPLNQLLDIFKLVNVILENLTKLNKYEKFYKLKFNNKNKTFNDNKVAELFSSIWPHLDNKNYYVQPFNFTKTRFIKSGFDPFKIIKNKICLDAGCGSGKFAYALSRFGAKKVIGLDLGKEGLNFAKKKAKEKKIKNIKYIHGSLINIPLKNNSIDFIWSNGVIHHTSNYEKCIKEFSRVLKPHGQLFLYVSGKCGLYEIIQTTLRKSLKNFPKEKFINFLKELNIDPGRIYWITDSCFAPYNWKSKKQVIKLLKKHNFYEIQQLKRGVSIDHIEQISKKIPYAKLKYGEGQLKFLAKLKNKI